MKLELIDINKLIGFLNLEATFNPHECFFIIINL